MQLSRDPVLLRDYAHAEAKRAGHTVVQPLHLVAAVARTDREAFAAQFGPEAFKAVQEALRCLPVGESPRSEASEFVTLLDSWTRSDDLVGLLRGHIPSPPADSNAGGDPQGGVPVGGSQQPAEAVVSSASAAGHRKQATFAQGCGEVVAPDAGILGREAVVAQLLELLAQQAPETPAIVGPPGSGRTAVLGALAKALGEPGCPRSLVGRSIVRIVASRVISMYRSDTLRTLIRDAPRSEILVLDDTDLLAALGGNSVDVTMIGAINALVRDPAHQGILVFTPAGLRKLEVVDPELHDRIRPVTLPPLAKEDLRAIGMRRTPELEAFHEVGFGPGVLEVALAPEAPSDRLAHPALMLDRLDLGAARASARPERVVTVADLRRDPAVEQLPEFDRENLSQQLLGTVVGQDHAIESVVSRLALTRRRLDLHPQRPDGVFLFVGPTGVGKTALATALAESLFKDREACIRLDMSEYAHDWALSRLIGPQPGYVGYTEPDGWLTTRIRERPHCVLLLDEIEKAHPTVWNAFLQVFDAGRLTDARSNVATFSDCIVVMTSNLGSEAFRKNPMGFTSSDSADAVSTRVVEAVTSAMAPELVNRLDQIIVFKALPAEAIHRIAQREVEQVLERLSGTGFRVTVSPEVVDLVGRTGYDPAYGARHLTRSIERLLLEPLVARAQGGWVVSVRDGQIAWEPAA